MEPAGAETTREAADATYGSGRSITPYQRWVQTLSIPVHRGYYIEDLRTLELGWWDERQCFAAILELAGQQGVSEARVSEVPPAQSTAAIKIGVDEIVYVAQGHGVATVWAGQDATPTTFEWSPGSMFLIPRNHRHQLSNTSGGEAARLLHCNYLPLAMSIIPEPDVYFESPFAPAAPADGPDGLFSSARMVTHPASYARGGMAISWYGNFFPDLRVWDKLKDSGARGGRARSLGVQFPNSPMSCHMAEFPAGVYKKAHRHGPAFVIVIPKGEGYSIMWPESEEKVVIPWHEASVFVPPARWYHQHFNLNGTPSRYLALHPPRSFSGEQREGVQPGTADQIEYTDEEHWVRELFAAELAKRGLRSQMPPEVYTDRDFQWGSE